MMWASVGGSWRTLLRSTAQVCWEVLAEPQGEFLQQRHPLIPKGGTALQVL